MTLALFVELVAKVGVPAAEFLYARYTKKDELVTPEDMNTLRELAYYTSHDALEKAGLEIKNGQLVRK